jgi:hypothetical protein
MSGAHSQPMGLSSRDASNDIQSHPTIHDAIQVHGKAQVLELFGDLRALDGSASRQCHLPLADFSLCSSTTIPVHLIQSRLVVENSPLSKVFTGFRDAARHMVATGTPGLDIINGTHVVVDLLFRERQPIDAFTCFSWASELCRSFGEVNDFVRIGCVFLLTRLMRVSLPIAEHTVITHIL